MIFVSVGPQAPFDRLCRAVDDWAVREGRDDVFIQTGRTDWTPTGCEYVRELSFVRFKERVREASLLVFHAGIGSIVSGIEHGRPMVIVPRLARFQETRNNHQVATAERFANLPGIHAARDMDELARQLDRAGSLEAPVPMSGVAGQDLIDALRDFIDRPD